MNKIENYLGIANHDIQMLNNSQELKSYVASILYENEELQQENQELHNKIDKTIEYINKHSFFVDDTGYGKVTGYPNEKYNAQELLYILKEVSGMKPLTLEETRLKEEMKQDCFWDNIHYKNPEAEKAFNLICHLEDFEIQYWELQQENEQLKANWNKLKEIVKSQSSLKQKCHNESLWFEVDELLSKMQELESSDVDE